MKRTVLILLLPLLILSSCAPKDAQLHALTRATPRFDAADARGYSQVAPDEDGSAWAEQANPAGDDPSVRLMSAGGAAPYIEVYTDKKSYLPGETINFHVSTNSETYSIEIRRNDWSRAMIAKVKALPGTYQPVPGYEEEPWVNGANWSVTYSWVIPEEWENGSYLAMVRTTTGAATYAYHPFIVRQRVPGSRSKIAFVMNYNTRNAYNEWGGKSLYETWVPGDSYNAVAVTFLRPFHASNGRGDNYWGQWQLISQLIADGFDPEYITEREIHFDPAQLQAYDVLVFSGHHEYISQRIYDALEAFHKRGGHIAFFSGNDIWWQVRYENGGDVMVGYRSYALKNDPMVGVNDNLVTTLWLDESLSRPGQALQGVSYELYSYCFEAEDYLVQDANHFIFEGTGLTNGDSFGSNVAAGESDMPGSASPPIMDVVLTARRDKLQGIYRYNNYVLVDSVGAAAVYYEDGPKYGFPDGKGGQIFAAGTHCGWGSGLQDYVSNHEIVRIATRNVIQHMVDAPRPKADYQDLATAMSHWLGQCGSPGWCDYSDINMDGVVDITDFAYLADDWSRE